MTNIEKLMSFVHSMKANIENCKRAVSNWLIVNGYAVSTRVIDSICRERGCEFILGKYKVEVCYDDGESFEVITTVPIAVAIAKTLSSDFEYALLEDQIEITKELSFFDTNYRIEIMQSYSDAIEYRDKLIDAMNLIANSTVSEIVKCHNDLQKKLESHVEFYCLPKS